MMLTGTETPLGPATVTAVEADRVRLDRDGGERWARLALSTPYRPEPGDVVLAIGEEDVYVIGVLRGRGKTVLRAAGDLEIRADGRVSIAGGAGVEVTGPDVTIRADRFETVARAAFERFVDCYRWVKELFQTRTGRSRTVVEGHSTLRAERIVETATKDVKIDGEKIHLG